ILELAADLEREGWAAEYVRCERRSICERQVQQHGDLDVLDVQRTVLAVHGASVDLCALRDGQNLGLDAEPAEAEADEAAACKTRRVVGLGSGAIDLQV